MKKINYMNRREGESEMEQLRSDEICGAVLDTLSSDYLSYISQLVKNSKTPVKKKDKQYHSSDSQQSLLHFRQDKFILLPSPAPNITYHKSHSASRPPSLPGHSRPQQLPTATMAHRPKPPERLRTSKQNSPQRTNGLDKAQAFTQSHTLGMTRQRTTQSGVRVCTYSSVGQSSPKAEPSIDALAANNDDTQFITTIDEYLSSLQENAGKAWKQERQRAYSRQEVEEMAKENIKLHKKVRNYQTKIQQLEEEVSNHLSHCKKRDATYKQRINELIKTVTQAASKINSQKEQLDNLKDLLRNFGQRARQIQHLQSEDSDEEDQIDISQSVLKMIRPVRANSDYKLRNKRGLESTMPRRQDW